MDNATNYIYIHRDPNDRLLATVEVYTEPLGKVPISGGQTYSDSSQFGRVLVAQIKPKMVMLYLRQYSRLVMTI